MSRKQVFTLDMPFGAEYVQLARLTLEDLARDLSCDSQDIDDIEIAIGEACTNAVRHGCCDSGQPHVSVKYIVQPDQITVQVCNATHPGAHLAVPDCGPCPEAECGYGLFIIRQLMDDVHIAHTPTTATVTMTKLLRS